MCSSDLQNTYPFLSFLSYKKKEKEWKKKKSAGGGRPSGPPTTPVEAQPAAPPSSSVQAQHEEGVTPLPPRRFLLHHHHWTPLATCSLAPPTRCPRPTPNPSLSLSPPPSRRRSPLLSSSSVSEFSEPNESSARPCFGGHGAVPLHSLELCWCRELNRGTTFVVLVKIQGRSRPRSTSASSSLLSLFLFRSLNFLNLLNPFSRTRRQILRAAVAVVTAAPR